jgi:hypothetical protein
MRVIHDLGTEIRSDGESLGVGAPKVGAVRRDDR